MDHLSALRAFVSAVDLGSFSRAAAAQGIKVSTVSRYVSLLEADLGAALLNRSTHGLHPTEIGRAFHARASQILSDLDEARDAARTFNAHPQGLLRLNAPRDFAVSRLLPVLPRFLAEFPEIRLDLDLTDHPSDLIATGADLGIRIGVLPDSSLVARRLAPHRCAPVASPSLLAECGTPAHPSALSAFPCLFSARAGRETWTATPPERDEAPVPVAVSGRFGSADAQARLSAALSGLGAALLPDWMTRDAVAAGRLVRLCPGWRWSEPDAAIWGVYPPKKIVSPKVRAMLHFLSATLNPSQD